MGFLLTTIPLLALVALASSITIQTLVSQCQQTVPFSDERAKSFLELNFPPEDQTTRCLMHCIGTSMKLFDPETGINLPNMKELLKVEFPAEEGAAAEVTDGQLECVRDAVQKKNKKKQAEGKEDGDKCLLSFRVFQCFEQEFLAMMRKDLEEKQK